MADNTRSDILTTDLDRCYMTEALIQVSVFPDATYDDFVDQFKEAEGTGQCRYGVFDAEYQTKDGNTKNKLVFFMW